MFNAMRSARVNAAVTRGARTVSSPCRAPRCVLSALPPCVARTLRPDPSLGLGRLGQGIRTVDRSSLPAPPQRTAGQAKVCQQFHALQVRLCRAAFSLPMPDVQALTQPLGLLRAGHKETWSVRCARHQSFWSSLGCSSPRAYGPRRSMASVRRVGPFVLWSSAGGCCRCVCTNSGTQQPHSSEGTTPLQTRATSRSTHGNMHT